MISRARQTVGEGRSRKLLQKCSPSPSGWLHPKCSKNVSKMASKWSQGALLALFILKKNRGAALGRPPSGPLLFFNMKSVKSAPRDDLGTIIGTFFNHSGSIFWEPAGRARGAFLGISPPPTSTRALPIITLGPGPGSQAL